MKNQFRSLDEDEVEFLDSVLESTRAKEAEVKKQTREQLEAFRRSQEEAEKAASLQDTDPAEAVEKWTVGPRKRKKGRENVIGGVKLRRASTTEKQAATGSDTITSRDLQGEQIPEAQTPGKAPPEAAGSEEPAVLARETPDANTTASKSPSPPAAALGLGAYSSDEDD